MKKTLLLIFAAALSLSMSAETVDDVLNQDATGVTGTTYTEFTYEGKSGAAYAGQCAGSYESIQLRSDTSKGYSGVVSTTTVGYARKLAVVWNENTTNDRTLNVYGSNTAYTGASDLYDSSAQGTLLGTIVYGTSTELEISGDYAYIGFRSNSSAMYLTSVTITWELDENAGSGNDDSGTTMTGDGTVDNPYTVADALAIIDAGTYTTDNVYVKGTVSQIDEISTSYGNATYYISDDGTTADQLEVYRGYYLGGAKFTSEDDLKVGDAVVVCGALTLYYSTAEITTGSAIYSINGETAQEEEGGEVDMDDPYTSNTAWTGIENAEVNDVAIIGDNEYLLVKLGTGSKVGSAYTTLPAGTQSLAFYCVAWKGKGDTPYTVTLEGIGEKSYTANANSGMNNNSPFTIATEEMTEGDYHVITFDALESDTQLTIETTSTSLGRVGIFGAKYYASAMEGDTLDEISSGEAGDNEDEDNPEEVEIGGLDTFENGGFEEWVDDNTPVGWKSTTTASTGGAVSKSEDAHSGNYSAHLVYNSESNKRIGSKEFLLPAATYTVKFYAKSVEANSLAYITSGYAPWDSEKEAMGTYSYGEYVTVPAEWTEYTYEFTLDVETQVNLVIMNNKSGAGDVLIDDYSIESSEPVEEGIHAIDAATTVGNGEMYNLSGQKVTESYRGIVIVNGKKYLNK